MPDQIAKALRELAGTVADDRIVMLPALTEDLNDRTSQGGITYDFNLRSFLESLAVWIE